MNKEQVFYLGPEGSYSYIMAKQLFDSSDKEYVPLKSPEEIVDKVLHEQRALGLIPIENSTTHEIHGNVDLMFKESLLKIVGEAYLKINLHEIGHEEAIPEDIKRVFSHPSALDQSSEFIKTNNIEPIGTSSTSEARETILKNRDKEEAIIGNKTLANSTGLKILKEDVGNEKNNYTRFLLVSSKGELEISPDHDKATIHFRVENGKDSLTQLFSKLDGNNTEVRKITSRPIPGSDFDYQYWVDIDVSNKDLLSVLDIFENNSSNTRLVGSYPKGNKYES